ncbi:unnamed protein product [Triticum turgidum subsp. durum]|uniref:DOG1 domain-containing protein n=1 Tax=Triticum turgidum subsp. durum TaxID=4567 RepID=A0A9R0VQH9_TRITD|nr:unnamed protein product [Triticum turgidum subsp. durum]
MTSSVRHCLGRDFQPAAYFGELEEALIHGANAGVGVGVPDHLHHPHPGGMIAGDAQAKSAAAGGGRGGGGYLAGAGRPPTLEIFPSWPMPHPQQLHSAGNSQSVGSTTDSSSARNTMAQMELVSPGPAGSVRPSPSSTTSEQRQRQEVMMVTTDDYSYKPGLPPPAAAGLAAAAPSFQQPHQGQQLQLHGGGDHDKTERRLAQNREAAKKSRLRKKVLTRSIDIPLMIVPSTVAYDCLNLSALFFTGLCAESGDQQGQASADGARAPESTVTGAAMFDMEYARWLDDDGKRLAELRGGLQAHLADSNLGAVVEECMQHYDELFQLKAELARADVFHLLTGAWATPAERCFFWMGGFRPSELLKIFEKADNLRQQTLHQMRRILTTRQAARCFLSIGEYYRRLRALSSLWASRPRENFIGTESLSPTGTELQGMQQHHQPQQNQFSGF